MNKEVKKVFMTIILSVFFTGIGHIYNGKIKKGCILIVVQFMNVLLMFIFIGTLLYLLVWIYAIIDAYNIAKPKKASKRDAREVSNY